MIKNPLAKQETRVLFLGWEDLLEKEMATHPKTIVWEIPQAEKGGGLPSVGLQRVGHNLATKQSQHSVK